MMNRVLPLLAALAVPAAAAADRAAVLTDFQGSVFVRRAEGGANVPASADMDLREGDVVRTGPKSMAEVVMDDEAVLLVQPDSELKVASLSRSRTFLSLTLGTILGKLKGLRRGESVSVRTLTAVCAVRGTEFGVEASSASTTAGIFEEGSMTVTSLAEEGEVTLGRNQETDVVLGEAPLPPRALKAFEFHRHRMAQIRRRYSRIRDEYRKRNQLQRKGLRRRLDRYRGLKGRTLSPEEAEAETPEEAEADAASPKGEEPGELEAEEAATAPAPPEPEDE